MTDARTYFPRGLSQPGAGFRFSMDALLLASFVGLGGVRRVADLGCGCGVVGFGVLLRDEALGARVVGVDLNPEMVSCARENVVRLGFEGRVEIVEGDVGDVRAGTGLRAESFDLVVCNPPYRVPGTGRRPPDAGRDAARFEGGASVGAFVGAASLLLKNRKRAAFIGLPERLPELVADMGAKRLAPKRLLLVHSRADEPARLALVEAVKNGGAGLVVEAPLVLYEGAGDETRLSARALEVCPFLACNA